MKIGAGVTCLEEIPIVLPPPLANRRNCSFAVRRVTGAYAAICWHSAATVSSSFLRLDGISQVSGADFASSASISSAR